jgi:hypothetical protein
VLLLSLAWCPGAAGVRVGSVFVLAVLVCLSCLDQRPWLSLLVSCDDSIMSLLFVSFLL